MADRLDEQVTWLGSDSSYRGEKTKRQRRRGHSKKQDRDMRTFYDADSFRPSSKQDISFLLSRSNSIATTLTSPGSTDVTALSSEGVQELARLLLWRQGLESEKHPAFTETELSYDDNLDDQDVHEAGSPTEDYETTFLRSLDQHSDSTTGRPMRNNCHADKLASRQRSPSPPNIQLLDVANIPPATITKEEFDVLPVTIQRKVSHTFIVPIPLSMLSHSEEYSAWIQCSECWTRRTRQVSICRNCVLHRIRKSPQPRCSSSSMTMYQDSIRCFLQALTRLVQTSLVNSVEVAKARICVMHHSTTNQLLKSLRAVP